MLLRQSLIFLTQRPQRVQLGCISTERNRILPSVSVPFLPPS